MEDETIEGLVVATPIPSHYTLVKKGLEHNKHIYVEKPLATSSLESKELVDLARLKQKKLMVGHILHYHSGLKALIRARSRIGTLFLVSMRRYNPSWAEATDVLWSLGIHDIAWVMKVFGAPENVFGTQIQHPRGLRDDVMLHLKYAKGLNIQIHMSRLLPYKAQKVMLLGQEGALILEEKSPNQPLIFLSLPSCI